MYIVFINHTDDCTYSCNIIHAICDDEIKAIEAQELVELELYRELMYSASPYQKYLMKWLQGKGKGDVKLIDIQKREDTSKMNGHGLWGVTLRLVSELDRSALIRSLERLPFRWSGINKNVFIGGLSQ